MGRTGTTEFRLRGAAVTALLLIVAGCGGGSTGMPTPTVSTGEIERLADAADTFAREHLEAWPDVDAVVADEYADGYRFADPTWSDYRAGSDNVIAMLRMWESITDYRTEVTGQYVSTTGMAFEQSWPGLQPPLPLPANPPVASGLTVLEFDAGALKREDLWYRAEDDVAYGIGCFAVDDCPAFEDIVDRYVAAWAAGDSGSIAALYAEDATFTDTLLGLEASDARAIGGLADRRFGSSVVTIEVLDLYAWTDGITAPTEGNPDAGRLIGIAIHYRATVDGEPGAQEAITTLELGIRTNRFDADPEGLIHREVVYHQPDVLLELVSLANEP